MEHGRERHKAVALSHVFDVRAEDVRLIAMEEVRNYGKLVYIKNIFEMAGGKMHTPHPTPWP